MGLVAKRRKEAEAPGQARLPISFRPLGESDGSAASPPAAPPPAVPTTDASVTEPSTTANSATEASPSAAATTPDEPWSVWLERLRDDVLEVMATLPEVSGRNLEPLRTLPIGRLRRGTVWRHGVTRYHKGREVAARLRARKGGPEDVRVVDLHPALQRREWAVYARFVLYHEFVHALGWNQHDAAFRSIERLWPEPEGLDRATAKAFSQQQAAAGRPWLWVCPSCDMQHPRAKRSNGRYHCKRCKVDVLDVRNPAYHT